MTQTKPPEQFDVSLLVQALKAATGVLRASRDPEVQKAANILNEGLKRARIKQ